MESQKSRFKVFSLRANPLNWWLFGIDIELGKCYLLEIRGNKCSKTHFLNIESARNFWIRLKSSCFKQVQLRDAGEVPSHVTQRFKEWSKFASHQLIESRESLTKGIKIESTLKNEDPWSNPVLEKDPESNLEETYSEWELKQVKEQMTDEAFKEYLIRKFDKQRIRKEGIEDNWEEPEPTYNDESRTSDIEEFSDFDNYWNQEGVFETDSDIHDY